MTLAEEQQARRKVKSLSKCVTILFINPGGITEGSPRSERSADLRNESAKALCTSEGCQTFAMIEPRTWQIGGREVQKCQK
jgi:hypothetical protein